MKMKHTIKRTLSLCLALLLVVTNGMFHTAFATASDDAQIPVAQILLDRAAAELSEGDTLSLTATAAPEEATDKGLVWSSSDDAIATVDQTGKVTAVKAGSAAITVTARDGSGVSATCAVTVTAGHFHGSQQYTKWAFADRLPTDAGSYYLDTDVDLAERYQPQANITICLNGHTITSTSASVTQLVFINSARTITFEDCHYNGSFADVGKITGGKGNSGWGGTIGLSNGSATLNIQGILLDGNTETGTANLGGGALTLRAGTMNVTDTKISNNKTTGLNGGAVYVNGGTLNVQNCVFENNSSDAKSGGAMHLQGGTTNIAGSFFTGNTGTNGAAIRAASGAALTIKDSTFTSNTDLATGSYSGAVYVLATDAAKTVIAGKTVIKGNRNASGAAADLMLQNAGTVFTLKDPTAETELNIRTFNKNKVAGSTLGVLSGAFAGKYTWTPDENLYVKVDGTSITLAEKVKVTHIQLDKTAVTVEQNSSVTLIATVTPDDATNKEVCWSSSDDGIATADQTGKVTAIEAGNATITATAADGSGVSADCTVTVEPGHFHDGVQYTKWTDATKLPTAAGSYCLETDVDLAAQYRPTKNITICLNGHTITATSASVTRLMLLDTANTTITFVDCHDDGTFANVGKITGGKGNSGYGGAISVNKDTVTLNMQGIILDGNTETGTANLGGGALLLRAGTVNMTDVKVSNNSTSALSGGTVYVNGGTLNVQNCVFENNTSGTKSGGALHLQGGTTSIAGSIFTKNTGTNGSAIRAASGADLTIKDSTFTGNTDLATGSYSGAVYVLATDAAKTVIAGKTVIKDNRNASGEAADLMLQNTETVFTLKNPTADTELNIRSFQTNKTAEAGKNRLGVLEGTLAGTYTWTGTDGLLIRVDASNVLCLVSTSVSLTERIKLEKVGDTAQLELSHNLGEDATVVWSSEDASVAAVDDRGCVTAKAMGTTTIQVSVNGHTASCKVSVGSHKHGDQEYAIWGSADSLPDTAGYYCLAKDVTVSTRTLLNSAAQDVHICTNGHSIMGDGQSYIYNITNGAVLEIENCLASYDANGYLAVTGRHVSKITGGHADSDFGGALNVNNATLKLNGLWITGNSAKQNGGYGGGAINVRGSGEAILTSCKLSDNTTTAEGGAIAIRDSAKLTLDKTVLNKNTAGTKGGAVYVSSAAKTAEIMLRDCIVTGNAASTDGGAIQITGGAKLTVEKTEFSKNNAAGKGGAICAEGTTAALIDAKLYQNTADEGGAIFVRASTVELAGTTTVNHNTATVVGGGISLAGASQLNMSSGVVKGNSAENGGGLIAASKSAIQLTGGEISGNTAANGGAGIYISFNSSMDMAGGVISGNTAAKGAGVYVNTAVANFLGGTIKNNTASATGGGVQQKDSAIVLDGTTISGNSAEESCGGVSSNGGTIQMRSGMVIGNTTKGVGGAFVLTNSAKLTMTGGEISGNKASSGAGAIVFSNSVFTLNSGIIGKNSAEKFGGGVYAAAKNGAFVMNGGSVSGNSAVEGAGGVFINSTASGSIYGGYIGNNRTGGSGAGIATTGEAALNLFGGTIGDNTARQNGGGVYVNKGGALKLSGVTISGNRSEKTGGGVYVYGNAFSMEAGTLVTKNAAGSAGGGIATGGGAVLRMNGGTVSYNEAPNGGGLVIQNKTGIVLNGGKICYNSVTDQGAGLYVGANVTFEMNDCEIYENTAVFRGAGLFINSSGTINGGKIHDNHILGGEDLNMPSGAGILLCGELPKTLTMNGGEIYNNDSSDHGAGVRVNKGTTFVLNGGKITGNTSGGCSGGVEVFGTLISNGGEITNNKAGLNGGAIRVGDHGRIELHNTLISGNRADKSGGGIRLNRGSAGIISDCTITGNTARTTGGAIYAIDDLAIHSCTITGNTAKENGAVFLDQGEYDGHSYFVGVFKITGNTVIKDNLGTAPGLYISKHTGVAIPAPGLGQKAYLDVFLQDGKLTDLVIGKYDYEGADGKYVITYGDRSYTDPETPPAAKQESPQTEPISQEQTHQELPSEEKAESNVWIFGVVGIAILAGAAVGVVSLSKKRKHARERKG